MYDSLHQHVLFADKFTGKERDSESGLDYFGARFDASSMGRFTSPDPVFINVMRVMDPQRLNLYAYGRNNPLVFFDPTGKDIVSGTGDQKPVRAALVEIARHPGGRAMLTKLDNLSVKIQAGGGALER
jgi:RHS repeat-associated protein